MARPADQCTMTAPAAPDPVPHAKPPVKPCAEPHPLDDIYAELAPAHALRRRAGLNPGA